MTKLSDVRTEHDAAAAERLAFAAQLNAENRRRQVEKALRQHEHALTEAQGHITTARQAMDSAAASMRAQDYRTAEEQYHLATGQYDDIAAMQVDAAAAPVDELGNARAVAKEWLAGVTALFGLFSLGAFLVGKDTIDGLEPAFAWPFGLFALVAFVSAAWAIGWGTNAAHGWPDRGPRQGILKLRSGPVCDVPRTHSQQLTRAVDYLEWSVWGAGLALISLAVAIGLAWIGRGMADSPPTAVTVRVVDSAGDAVVCGSLQRLTEDLLIVRDTEGADRRFALPGHRFVTAEC